MKYREKLAQQFAGLEKLSGAELEEASGCTKSCWVYADEAICDVQYECTR